MKRGIALFLIVALWVGCLPVYAAEADDGDAALELAEQLYSMGLFLGADTDANGDPVFALDRDANRVQAVVMLIRLLGEEEDALASTAEHPFTDVPRWADRYVAYAWEHELANGVGNGRFGSNSPTSAQMFLTFTLRALGYRDTGEDTDFTYREAERFAAEIGLPVVGGSSLKRGDMVVISAEALDRPMKGGEKTLLEDLVERGVVSDEAVDGRKAEAPALQDGDKVEVPAVWDSKYTRWSVESKTLRRLIPGSAALVRAYGSPHRAEAAGISVERLALYQAVFTLVFQLNLGDELMFGVQMMPDKEAVTMAAYRSEQYDFLFDEAGNLLAYCPSLPSDQGSDAVTFVIKHVDCSPIWSEISGKMNAAIAACRENTVTVDMNTVTHVERNGGDRWHPIYLNGVSLADLPGRYTVEGFSIFGGENSNLLTRYNAMDSLYRVIYEPVVFYIGGSWVYNNDMWMTEFREENPNGHLLEFVLDENRNIVGYFLVNMELQSSDVFDPIQP